MFNLFSKRDAANMPAMPAVEIDPDNIAAIGERCVIADVELVDQTAVATLTVTDLSTDSGVEQLADLLDAVTEAGVQRLVLDVQNVQMIDSACLGCLVQTCNRITASGGRIAVANAAKNVQYVFRLTCLDRVFPICNDVISAMDAVVR